MGWIQTLEPGDDTRWDEVRSGLLEKEFLSGQSTLPNILSIMSLNPEACQSVADLHEAVTFGGSSLKERWEQMVSLVVSVENECHY